MNILPTADAAARFAADHFATAAANAIRARGRFVAALAGGTTPKLMYSHLAADANVDWRNVVILFGDERCVPPDDAASNYRMVTETLLSRVSMEEANVHRMHGEAEPRAAARAYEQVLRSVLATAEGAPSIIDGKRIDFVLLGLGEDGHTASLFPGARAAHDSDNWAEATVAPAEPSRRITLTPRVINAAADVMFLVTGTAKAEILRRVREGARVPHELPAQLIDPVKGALHWVVDQDAARAPSGGAR